MAGESGRRKAKSGVDRWKEMGDDGAKAAGRGAHHGSGPRRMSPQVRRYVSTLVVLVVVLGVCVLGFTPLGERITTGLDIQGGVSVIMRAQNTDGSTPSSGDMVTATSIVQNRVNALGAAETSVQQQGSSSILIQIPGATNADEVIDTLGQTGHLEFVRVDQIGDADALARLDSPNSKDIELKEGTYTPFMDGSCISHVTISQDNTKAGGGYSVNLTLNDEGTKRFSDVTSELAATRGRIAIVLDGVIDSAPVVQSAITNGQVSITGHFSLDDAQQLKTVLDSGSLPVTLTYSESRVVGPTLGQDSLHQGIFAIAVGVAIVIVYLFLFYHGLGLLTMGSLGVFAVLYLGLLALLSHFGAFALTLPGLAGVVLTTGSAADSSILVLERFREEIRMGRSVRQASVSGARHGIQTSLDADAVTMVTALALFFVAVGSVKGFGLTLALGIVCDVITMFCFKAPVLRLLARRQIEHHPRFWGVAQDLQEAERTRMGAARKGGVAHA